MTVGNFDRRSALALAACVIAILGLRWWLSRDRDVTAVIKPADSIPAAEQRLERLRRIAALMPARQAELKQADADLAVREKGLMVAETAAQAHAQVLELLRRVGQKNGIQVRGAEEMKVRAMGNDYGEVSVVVSIVCGIEQLVNMLADLTNEPQLVATSELRIAPASAKEKTVAVRLGVSAAVPRKLVPEKKGTSF